MVSILFLYGAAGKTDNRRRTSASLKNSPESHFIVVIVLIGKHLASVSPNKLDVFVRNPSMSHCVGIK